jgi:glycosyltransferase involved in cell wall biosynthesis
MLTSPKNILYVGPYRQNDGWGLAARDCLLSLLTTGHNISAVPVYLNYNAKYDILDKNILEAEKNISNSYDIVIQKALPSALSYNGNYAQNIAIIFLENNKLFSDGVFPLNSMNQILVSTQKEVECLKRSGVNTKANSIMQPIGTKNISKFSEYDNKLQFAERVKNSYKFYYIGENIQRKNIKDLIAAFCLEFDETDDVCFVLKTNIPGLSATQASQKTQEEIHNIQKSLRTRKKFAPILTITERLQDEQLLAIHNSCDCFVVCSYGEAFCRPAAEALCFGNYVILSEGVGIKEMIDSNDFGLVSCQEQPVIMQDYSYLGGIDMYNGEETWSIPSVLELKRQMRLAFENRPQVDSSKYLSRFSYENIGQNICQYIQ